MLPISHITAVVLTTLLDSDGKAPNGVLWAGLMARAHFDDYMFVVNGLKSRGYMTEKGNLLCLTESGEDAARKIDDALKAARAKVLDVIPPTT